MSEIKRQETAYTLFIISVLVFMVTALIMVVQQRRELEILQEELSRVNAKVIELQSKYDNDLSHINTSILTLEKEIKQLKEKR